MLTFNAVVTTCTVGIYRLGLQHWLWTNRLVF